MPSPLALGTEGSPHLTQPQRQSGRAPAVQRQEETSGCRENGKACACISDGRAGFSLFGLRETVLLFVKP